MANRFINEPRKSARLSTFDYPPACLMPHIFLPGVLLVTRALTSAILVSVVFVSAAFYTPAFALAAADPWQSAPHDVQVALKEVVKTRDHRGMPFAIVDKKTAQLFVFDGAAQLQGSAPVLLGLAPGDIEPEKVAGADGSSLTALQRTTPAGRFVSEPGHNLSGEAIVWVDYTARLAIHRLRPAPPHERRAERLASSTPDDNRITLGCVVVAPAFYDAVVAPVLGLGYGVVYVLPENEKLQRLQAAAN